MTCPDLCTAEKCRELEARIGELEQAYSLIKASFEAHTQQPIPIAHDYDGGAGDLSLRPSVGVYFDDGILEIFVGIGDRYDRDSVAINNETTVAFDIFDTDDGSYVFKVNVNGETDEDTLTLPESNLSLDGIFQGETLTLTVADSTSSDTTEISIPLEHEHEHLTEDNNSSNNESTLRGSASFRDGVLTVTISDGTSFDSFQVGIPTSNTNTSPQTIFVTEEIYMNCDELERTITDCCRQIIEEIDRSKNIIIAEIDDSENNLINQIDAAQFAISSDLKTVEDYVTVDISGTVENGACKIPLDDDGEPLPIKRSVELETESYSGQGFAGLNKALALIEKKLTSILEHSCAAIEPDYQVDLSNFARHCSIDLPERESYSTDALWFEAVKTAITGLSAGATLKLLSKGLSFTPGSPVTFAVTATASYIYKHLLDQTFNQEAIAYNDICSKFEELEDSDVVSLVASPKYVTNIDGKVLVLHFVTLDNYPRRKAGSYPRQIQIPGAKEQYDWIEDFLNLRWFTGNQYGELELEGYRAKVSGWFADKNAANSYFDAVLELTTAREVNRNLPNHSNPRTDIVSVETRPYRAFIESVDETGTALCHAKYVPVALPNDGNSAL